MQSAWRLLLSCIPISFARFTERAVVRFMKLIQAINKIKMATILNSCTY